MGLPPRRHCRAVVSPSRHRRTHLQHLYKHNHVCRHQRLPCENRRSEYRRNLYDTASHVPPPIRSPPPSCSFKLTQPQSFKPRRNLPPHLRLEARRRTHYRNMQPASKRPIRAVLVRPGARAAPLHRPGRRMRDAARRILSYECAVCADRHYHFRGVYQTCGDPAQCAAVEGVERL